MTMSLLPFNSPGVRYFNRVGPHDIKILSILFGSLLGDSNAERTKFSTSIVLQQEDSNMEYIMWYHKRLVELGYCRLEKPSKEIRITKDNKIRYFYRIKTFPFSSFNWIHDAFYPIIKNNSNNQVCSVNEVNIAKISRKKIVPIDLLDIYLTPEALAIWIMDDGTKNNNSIRLCTHSFTKSEVLALS